jgi:hypothetical protein
MKCVICGKECNEGFLRLGGYCGEEHKQELLARHRRLLDDLRQEDIRVMPEILAVADFERLALKLAVHLILGMNDGLYQLYRDRSPELLEPLEMAAFLKALILSELPASHVAREEARGLQRFFCDGTYSFPQLLPARLVVEAMEKAHVLPWSTTKPD